MSGHRTAYDTVLHCQLSLFDKTISGTVCLPALGKLWAVLVSFIALFYIFMFLTLVFILTENFYALFRLLFSYIVLGFVMFYNDYPHCEYIFNFL